MLPPQSLQLRVGVDVGTRYHSVAVGLTDGRLLEEFEIPHTAAGFRDFFARIEGHAKRHPYPIAVAMEGYNGHVRPLDSLVKARGWLFPGRDPVTPLTTRQLNRVCLAAAEAAGIDKRVSLHTLRHSFATHLLEQKVDIRVIQVLLGHKKLERTALCAQLATRAIRAVRSPLEHLTPGLPPPA